MIKGDIQISEPAMDLPPMQLRKDLETNLLTEETRVNKLVIEKTTDKLEVKNHFARLKRRMRGSSSGIF
jgi:hypothetical protein